MNKTSTIKKIALAAAISGICMSQSAIADYTLQTVSLGQNSNGSYDMESGKVIKLDSSNTGQKVVLIDGAIETTIKDSSAIKSDIGLSNNTAFWTEFTYDPVAGEGYDELYNAKDGIVSQLTNTGTAKEGFTYSDGKAAWVEKVNGHNQLFLFDGTTVNQITNVSTDVYISSGSTKSINMQGDQIAFNAYVNSENAVYHYANGSSQRISPVGMNVSWSDIDNGVIVWTGINTDGNDEVFKWENGTVTQITHNGDSGYRDKIDAQINGNQITWKVLTDQTRQVAELYVRENDTTILLSANVQGNTQIMGEGKIIWTEGISGTPNSVHEYANGISEEIHTGLNPIGLDISGDYVSWREGMYPIDPYLTVAKEITVSETVRVEAESFIAQEGIQTEATSDEGGGENIGWVDAGDWMTYEVNVPASENGQYEVTYRLATAQSTGAIRLETANGEVLDSFSVANTGDWQNWETVTRTVTIPTSGAQYLTVAANSGPWNMNWLEIKAVVNEEPETPETPETPAADPIQVEAENYVAMSGVQLENTSDVDGGQNVGYLDAGDWMSYPTVNVPTAGTYTLELRVANNGNSGVLSFERAGGSQVYSTVSVPSTGGWQNWTTVSVTIELEAGEQEFGIGIQQGGFNLNWFKLTAQ